MMNVSYVVRFKKETRHKKTLVPHREVCFPMTGADKSNGYLSVTEDQASPKTVRQSPTMA